MDLGRAPHTGERGAGQEPSGAVEVEIAIDADSGWWQPAGADHVSRPAAVNVHPAVPAANTLGLHRIMFAVDDIDPRPPSARPRE